MIPYQVALFAWIPAAALLMMDRNSARGFTIAFVLGQMILPEAREYMLPGVPDLGKANVTVIGVFIGTILFHPDKFDRFRLVLSDMLLALVVLCTFYTAFITTGFDVKITISDTLAIVIDFVLLVILARIHIGTPAGVKTLLLGFVIGAVIYAPLAMLEWRLSPQIHTYTYGYFQHVFQQHARGSAWRPIVYFSHALALGRFFAFAAFLALFPLRRDLVQLFGRAGNFVFLAPLFGLILSMSYGPMLIFVLMCGLYLVVHRAPWAIWVLPVTAYCWLTLTFLDIQPLHPIVKQFEGVNVERADSLQYRLDALDEYGDVIFARPLFGYGLQGDGRIEGRATDSQALISLLARGVVGTVFYLGWYACALWAAMRIMQRTRGTVFWRRAAGIACMASLHLTLLVVDAGLDLWFILTLAPMIAIASWLKTEPNLPALATQRERRLRIAGT